jgi:alpha-glucosidase
MGTLYEDDGRSLAYTRRGYLRQTVRCTITPTGLSIDFAKPEGSFKPWWKSIAVTVHNWTGAGAALAKTTRVAVVNNNAAATATVTVPMQARAGTIAIDGRQARSS